MADKFSFLKGKLASGRTYPEFFPFKNSDKVVNIGCGQGPQAIVYKDQYQEMIGVDLSEERLLKSREAMELYRVKNYRTLQANVEDIPLPSDSFDKAIAVDIIEHVQNPEKLCAEAYRLLKYEGEFMVTYPSLYDHYTDFLAWLKKIIKGQKKEDAGVWHPDKHNQRHSLKNWITLTEAVGFKLERSRATTMFPPLHLLGIPRFWYTNNFIHKIDSFFCRLPVIKNFGQTLLCVFKKQ